MDTEATIIFQIIELKNYEQLIIYGWMPEIFYCYLACTI